MSSVVRSSSDVASPNNAIAPEITSNPDSLSRPRQGERTDPRAGWLEHDEAPCFEGRFQVRQVGEEQRNLSVGAPLGSVSEEDHRWPWRTAQREQCAPKSVSAAWIASCPAAASASAASGDSACRSGTSLRSSQWQLSLTNCLAGMAESLADVLGFEVGVLPEDLLVRYSVGDQSQNGGDGDAKPADAGHASHLLGIDGAFS